MPDAERPASYKKRRFPFKISLILVLITSLLVFFFSSAILTGIGTFLVRDDTPVKSQAVVVLSTGMEYYPRLIEAADLFKKQVVRTIVVNGNRKTNVLRALEAKGFTPCCPWNEGTLRVLDLYGVPRKRVISISGEDVYDTVSEAALVGNELIKMGFKKIIITTSKSHTRRAGYIWSSLFKGQLKINMISAKTDPYDPGKWWTSGRQVRLVLSEYGAWLYFWWKNYKCEV